MEHHITSDQVMLIGLLFMVIGAAVFFAFLYWPRKNDQ